MRELTTHQFILISLFVMLSTKILTLQPIVFEQAEKDSFWSILIGAIIDLLILFLVVWIMKKYKDITFSQLLNNIFGKIFSRIILIILFIFILLKAQFLYEETFSFFIQFLYDDLSLIIYILPIVFVTGYFTIKGITTTARTIEIFSIFILIGVIISSLTVINGATFKYITPFFENGFTPTLLGLKAQIFYRGNAVILLCFMGKINFSEHFNIRFIITNVLMTLLCVAVGLLFYMVYGPSVKYVEFTLADLPQYDPFVSDLGRFNWLCVIICTLALILTNSILLYCLTLIIRWIFNIKRSLVPTIINLSVMLLIAYFNNFSIVLMEEKIVTTWAYITGIALIFYLLILFIIVIGGKKWTKLLNIK